MYSNVKKYLPSPMEKTKQFPEMGINDVLIKHSLSFLNILCM